jgi:hypothetical protein
MEHLVDAFLYVGPQDLRLKEQLPADIALDIDYRAELRRREALPGLPVVATESLKDFRRCSQHTDPTPINSRLC